MLVVGAQGDDAVHVPFFEDVQDGVDGDHEVAPLAVDEDDSEAAVDDHYYRWWMTPAGTSKSPEDCTSRLSCYKTGCCSHVIDAGSCVCAIGGGR